jgi:hypothetical protein
MPGVQYDKTLAAEPIFSDRNCLLGVRWRVIAMRTEYLAAVVIAAFAAGAGLAAYSVRDQADFCPQPWARSVTVLYAPCPAFYGATGDAILKPEIMRMAVLTPDEQPDLPATLAARWRCGAEPMY